MSSDGKSEETYNPFEVDICSLSLPACSPDVFNKISTPQKADLDDSFCWSIDEVARLKPANIDEVSHNTTTERWDEEKENRAQKAIETFFLQNSVCPSPWNGAMAFKHVTFSPNLASTAYYSRSDSPFKICSTTNGGDTLAKKDAWTQTTLVIPEEIDIFQLLGQFFTFLEDQKGPEENESDAKDVVNSSLRRKLFSPQRLGDAGSPLRFCTPQKNLLERKLPSPSSAGTYFSSSPISVKNCSISSLVNTNRVSPPVSPIVMSQELKEGTRVDLSPVAPSIHSEGHLKSILKDVPNRSPNFLSVSMSSETTDDDAHSQDMDAENTRCDLTRCSAMSGVQYSLDEQALNAQSDTGYQTLSSCLESTVSDAISINVKDRLISNWLCQSRDNKLIDSIVESSTKPHLLGANGSQETPLWKPHIFSTPQ